MAGDRETPQEQPIGKGLPRLPDEDQPKVSGWTVADEVKQMAQSGPASNEVGGQTFEETVRSLGYLRAVFSDAPERDQTGEIGNLKLLLAAKRLDVDITEG